MSTIEYRRDPQTGTVWGKQTEQGSIVTCVSRGDATRTRTVSYATWLTWERIG